MGQISVLSFSKHQNPSWEVPRTVEKFPPFYGTRKLITMKLEVLSDVSTSLDVYFRRFRRIAVLSASASISHLNLHEHRLWTSHLAFLAVFTTARLLSVSWATLIQYISSNSIYLRCTLILSFYAYIFISSLFFVFGQQNMSCIFLLPVHVTCCSHFIFLYMVSQVIFGQECKTWSSSLHSSYHASLTFSLSDLNQQHILEHNSPVLFHDTVNQTSLP